MNRFCLLTLACIAVSLPQAAQALDATSANALATSVLSQLGRTKGFCAVPNCGNGQLALSFLQLSGMKVHAMDAGEANLAAARALAQGAGFYAPRFYADKGSLSLMPYAARFVDCIVITNVTDAGLAGVPYAEIERVLCPGGKAWIGRATSEGAGVTQAALQSWINAATKRRSTAVVSTTEGTWALVTGTELSGVDVWVRHNYDASGIKYSKDSVAAFPWLPQAKIKPYRKQTGGTVVTSGGRMYYVSVDQLPNGSTVQMLRTYSIYNGELLWTRNVGSDNLGNLSADPIIAYGQDIYLNKSGSYLRLNGLTGADLGTVATVPSDPPDNIAMPTTGAINGCPPRSASINATYGSTGVYGWDFLDNVQRAGHFYKPPCGDIGTIQSNGLHINAAPTCICGSSRMQGTHVDATDRTFQFDRDAPTDGAGRLEQGPAFSDLSAQIVPDSLDWAMHRSTVAHNGRSLAQVPATAAAPALMWNRAPACNYVTAQTSMAYDYLPEQEPTPPAVVAGHTFFGGSDGYVRCIDNGTGLITWSYSTGGRIYATPTVWNGCVYVGSGDGFAYCIEAHTGRLVWRYQAAPVDRRFNLYGVLSSMWPVLSGVLVYNGNAFFAAGLQSEYGSHLYCVNARTGALVWQNNHGGTWLNAQDRLGYTPCGYLTVARNRLIAANSVAGTATFSLTTGAQDPLPTYGNMGLVRNGYPAISVSRGREIGVINDNWLVRGARTMFSDHNTRYFIGWWPTPNFVAFNQLDANGAGTYPAVAFGSVTMVAPAWDAGVIYQCMYSGTLGLRQYALATFTAKVDEVRAADMTDGWGIAGDSAFQGAADRNVAPYWWPAENWVRSDVNVSALAAAPNALVALYSKSATSGRIPVPETVDWYVGVFSKANGTTTWEARLPDVGTNLKGEPLFEGLAIDRNGYIIVMQRNGNVLCYGNGTVSVARRDETMPAPAASPARLASSSAIPGLGANPSVQPPAQDLSAATPGALEAVGRAPNPGPTRASCPVTYVTTDAVNAPDYARLAAADNSDLVTAASDSRVHSLSPVERIDRAKESERIVDNRWKPQAACLTVMSVTASSASTRANGPANTLDRDLRTRWSPTATGEQWLSYDLGAVREVSSASIVWFSKHTQAIPLTLELSLDGKQYHVAESGALEGRGTNEALRSFVPQQARFVRVSFALKPGSDLPAVQEVGIHGEQAAEQARAE
jgi:outer membrane protein assembly factor BamB